MSKSVYMIKTPVSQWFRCGAISYFTILARIQRGDGEGYGAYRRD